MKPEQTTYVEHVGRFWESLSMSRTAGRILGWLMICEPAYQSATDLVNTLEISTGSVSTQVRLLERIGLVERITFRGDRARYYQLPDHVWAKTLNTELDRIRQMRTLAEAGSALVPTTRPERITELGAIAQFFEDEWPDLLARMSEEIDTGRGFQGLERQS